jgi:hypothetical protein
MHIRIYIGPLFGMGIFSFGLYSLRYVQSRVFRSSKQVKNMRDLIRKYRALISSGSAPSWPLACLIVCCPLGILIMFASLILVK